VFEIKARKTRNIQNKEDKKCVRISQFVKVIFDLLKTPGIPIECDDEE
jgi:hypothetical protein